MGARHRFAPAPPNPVNVSTGPSPFANPGPPSLDRRSLFGLASRRAGAHWIRVTRQAMACRFEVTLAGDDERHVGAAHDALAETGRLEASWTLFRDTSDLCLVNRDGASRPVPVPAALYTLLARCRDLHRDTAGAFDVTTTPLSRCWGFLQRRGCLPDEAALARARSLVGMDALTLDDRHRTVSLTRPGAELNLASIGKGAAVDAVAARLRHHEVSHALASAGGSSIVAVGGRGRGWQVELTSRQAGRTLGSVWLRDAAMATSGAGEQFVEVDGVRYGHVIDPRTGWPARGTLSASVITSDGTAADALATAFLIGGAALAERYCRAHPGTLAILTPDGDEGRPVVIGRGTQAQVEV
jgi:thiamine biosynthesis lipoprotein